MNDLEQAKSMLTMAERDLKALKGMGDAETFADEIFGFHAQQVVEKTLKAWIVTLGVEYPFVHDISRLLAVLEEGGCNVEKFWDLVEYNAFAIQFRYEAFDPTERPLDRPFMIGRVQALWGQVKSVVEDIETKSDKRPLG